MEIVRRNSLKDIISRLEYSLSKDSDWWKKSTKEAQEKYLKKHKATSLKKHSAPSQLGTSPITKKPQKKSLVKKPESEEEKHRRLLKRRAKSGKRQRVKTRRDRMLKARKQRSIKNRKDYNDHAASLATKFGFDSKNLRIRDDSYTATLNGVNFNAAGTYSPLLGQIDLFRNHLKKEDIGRILSHEVMHHKFETVGRNDKVRSLIIDNIDTLHKEDGVTPYSSDYWKGVGNNTVDSEIAVNETLAEVAKLDYENGGLDNVKIHPVWKKIYNTINQEYSNQQKKA